MAGRNGFDNYGRFLSVAALILLLISMFFGESQVGRIIEILGLALLVYAYFRILSRKVYKRREENGKYLRLKYKVTSSCKVYKERWTQRRDYKFFTCPSCKTVLRVPRGKGRVRIVCRKCGASFEGKT